MRPDQFVLFFKIFIVIVIHIRHMYKTLDRIFQFYISAPSCDPRDHAVKFFADPLFHILHFFQLHGLTLGFLRTPFRHTGLQRHFRQDLLIMCDTFFPHSAAQIVFDDPVDLKIRIPADRRSKMRIIFCRQTKMPRILRTVFCLFHRAERQTIDQCFLRRSLGFAEKLLYFHRAHAVSDMDMIAEVIDQCAQLLDLFVIRRLMRPV